MTGQPEPRTVPIAALVALARVAERCSEEVSRKGEAQPCDKPAVAVRFDDRGGSVYPVCSYHTRVPMVPLSQLLGVTA